MDFTLNQAFKNAKERRHEFMTVDHLLLALLDNLTVVAILRACGADIERMRKSVQSFVEETTPLIPDEDEREIQPTLGF